MANIKNHLNNIKNALFGQEVRGSIHDGIDAINKEVESTTGRQVDLEKTFDQLVINAGNSNAEIVDARVKSDGTSYSKLGDRLNEVDSQLEQKADEFFVGEYVNVVKYAQLKNISLDDAIIELEGEKLFFPNGTHEINNLNSVNNVKGESENNTIIKIVSGRDIQPTAFTIYENIKIDLDNQGSLLAPRGDASATNLLKLYKVHICNAINGVVTQLGTHIVDCEIYNCSSYGIYNKGLIV